MPACRASASCSPNGAFIGDDMLVAHNAAFDLGVIRSGLEVSGLPGPAYDYVCTVMMARRCYSLVSYSLPFAAEEAGVPMVNHHDAADDARACAAIMVDIAGRNGAASIAELYLSLGMAVSHQPAFDPRRDPLSKATLAALEALAGEVQGRRRAARSLPAGRRKVPTRHPMPRASPDHPLFGQTVVFTGELAIPRPEAKVRSAEPHPARKPGHGPHHRAGGGRRLCGRGPALRPDHRKGASRAGTARTRAADRSPVRGGIPADGRRTRGRRGRHEPDRQVTCATIISAWRAGRS